jgi:hypothetical protein
MFDLSPLNSVRCRRCGCSDFAACVYFDGVATFTCHWVEEDLCNLCAVAEVLPVLTLETTGGVL